MARSVVDGWAWLQAAAARHNQRRYVARMAQRLPRRLPPSLLRRHRPLELPPRPSPQQP